MSKRNIGQEIIQGLEEIKAWKRGELKLKTHTIEMPKAADAAGSRLNATGRMIWSASRG